ncbi:MAG: LapA family protein [Spirochaetales bacterium]|nr:LapA family protein [Spirochaetales bacterium]
MKFIFGIIIGIFVLIFVAQNPQVVDLTFLKWSFSVSRAIMYLMMFIAGAISGGLVIGIRKSRKSTKK